MFSLNLMYSLWKLSVLSTDILCTAYGNQKCPLSDRSVPCLETKSSLQTFNVQHLETKSSLFQIVVYSVWKLDILSAEHFELEFEFGNYTFALQAFNVHHLETSCLHYMHLMYRKQYVLFADIVYVDIARILNQVFSFSF